jgi:peptidoglycan/LPS O-acetylase OafA/YrhL
MKAQQELHRSIPSLDGLRAFSVLAVILGHTEAPVLRYIPFMRNGSQGVAVFFVLSGFLITHLLLKEINQTGQIDLKRFYFRRTFRIFPPFYVFLAVVAVLSGLHLIVVRGVALAAAATYTWNYVPLPEQWVLGHCWSLSLEEQFYLVWPASMVLFSKKTNFRIALGVILLSPFSRLITYYVWPSMRYHIDMMLHTHLDTIMMGCLLSLMLDLKIWEHLVKRAISSWAVVASIIFLIAVDAPAAAHWRGMYKMTVGISLENVAIAIIVLYSAFRHTSLLGKILNLKWISHLGMISYSLYLWQQLFTGYLTRLFPLNIVAIVICAELSFWLVERPSLATRDYIGKKLFPNSAAKTLRVAAAP